MFERLMLHGAALAQKAARERREALAEALAQEAPQGVAVSEDEAGIVLAGRGLEERFALDRELRWLLAGRPR
jgi:DNA-binding transcriptional MocR family regulator